MRIERVDDKTVKCFLSNEEMEEYDIDYKDFILRSEKAKEVVEDIMAQAAEKVGYKPPKYAFDLQIMLLPDHGLILTFSEKDPLENQNSAQLLQYLKELKDMVQKVNEGHIQEKDSAKKADSAIREEKEKQKPDFAVFCFKSLRSILEYAEALPANLRVRSALYEMNGWYYLYLHKGGASYERYSRACVQALEFGSLYTAERESVLYLEEHAKCLVPEKALKKLRFA